MNRTGLAAIVGFLAFTLTAAQAQFTADFQTNIISGVTSNWVGYYFIGSNTFANVLLIENGGVFSNDYAYLGFEQSSSNNAAVITGSGSIWGNSEQLTVGYWGAGNQLVVSNGGKLVASYLLWIGGAITNSSNNSAVVDGVGSVLTTGRGLSIGIASGCNSLMVRHGGQVSSGAVQPDLGFTSLAKANNSVWVSDPGSKWQDTSSGLILGGDTDGPGNRLVISNQGQVVNLKAHVGFLSDSNSVRIVDGGVWQSDILSVGFRGSSNSVVVAGGTLLSTNLIVGVRTQSWDNVLELDSGSVIVTNATGDAVLEVRRGTLTINGGTLQVDRFVMTNSCAQFVRTDGSLIYGTAILDPNRDADGDSTPNGWEQSYGLDPLNAADADEDSDGDGQNNLAEFLAGTDPTNSASAFRIIEVAPDGDDMVISWAAVGAKRYAVQTTIGDGGSYSNDFVDLNPAIVAPGTGETVVTVLHLNGATNAPARFYRIRLVP